MKMFSENALGELSRFGLHPFPILHVKEMNMKQPLMPVTLFLPMNGELKDDEKVFVLCEDNDEIKDVTNVTSYEIGRNFLSVGLNDFSV